MSEVLAWILLPQLDSLPDASQKRFESASFLAENLSAYGLTMMPFGQNVTTPALYTLSFRYESNLWNGVERVLFIKAMKAEGVPVQSGWSNLGNDESCFYSSLDTNMYPQLCGRIPKLVSCNTAEQISQQTIQFPHPVLSADKKELKKVIHAVNKLWDNRDKLVQYGN